MLMQVHRTFSVVFLTSLANLDIRLRDKRLG